MLGKPGTDAEGQDAAEAIARLRLALAQVDPASPAAAAYRAAIARKTEAYAAILAEKYKPVVR